MGRRIDGTAVRQAGRGGQRGRRSVGTMAALAAACALVLSGCFLRSMVAFVGDDGHAVLSANVEVGFCDFDTTRAEFWGCTYTGFDQNGFIIEIVSTFELIAEFGIFGLIIDPVIVQVPEDATNVEAIYNNAGSDEPAVITETTSFPVTPDITVTSEPGTKFLILELPDDVADALDPAGTDFDFVLEFDVNDPTNLFVKPMYTARIDEGGTRYYLPTFPCVTDFSQIPAVQVPVGGTFQDLRPALAPLVTNAQQLTCNDVAYDFSSLQPAPTTTEPPATTEPPVTTAPPTTAAPATAAPTTAAPTTAPPPTPAPPPSGQLPETGSGTGSQLALAATALLGGAFLLLLAARRRA